MSARQALVDSDAIAGRVGRFGIVGAANGVFYAGVTALLVNGFGIAPVVASVAGYLASVPIGFIGHRRFSFHSRGHWTGEAVRFFAVQAMNVSVTVFAMHSAIAWLGASYVWGMVLAIVLVPLCNFACLNFWVFRSTVRQPRTDLP